VTGTVTSGGGVGCQSRDSARPYSTSPSASRTSANHEAVIPDVARVSGCFIVDVSTPCFPYRNDSRVVGAVDGRRRTEATGERRHASSSTVERWEHKIEDVPVGRLHRSSISSQLVHSVLAQTYLWPYPPSIRLYRRTCGPGAIPRQFGCNSTHQNLVVRYLTRRCSIFAAASLPRGRSLAPARLPFSLGRRSGHITS